MIRITGFLSACILSSMLLHAQCTVDAGPDLTICPGSHVQLNATGQLIFSYSWSPAYGLNQTYVQNPVASPVVTTPYVVSVITLIDSNYIINGDFEAGNTGFTSNYTFNPTSVWNEGTYAVVTNPFSVHSNFAPCTDHTTGTGMMMVVNGAATPNVYVWCQTVNVTPNTDYAFSTWLATVYASSPAVLQFSINNTVLGSPFTASSTNCIWQQFYEIWNSGVSATAQICIVNQNTATSGNDFALDDISFQPFCVASDTVTVIVDVVPADAGADTTVCPGTAATLTATGGVSYKWSTAQQGPTIQVYPRGDSTFYVTVTDAFGCKGTDSVRVSLYPAPNAEAGPDQHICHGDTAVLTATGGTAYLWSSGQALQTIHVSPPLSGIYYVSVFDDHGCMSYDSLFVFIEPRPWTAIWASDTVLCQGELLILSAGGEGAFLWSTGDTTPQISLVPQSSASYTVTVTGTNGCASTCSSPLKLNPEPSVSIYASDSVFCIGSDITLYARGASLYRWFPFSGLSDSSGQSVTASPPGSFEYFVIGIDDQGCDDTAAVKLEGLSCEVIIPNVFTPNGDEKNDLFEVRYDGFGGYELRIYNRWGRLVYESLDKEKLWDGRIKGSPADQGVYYYVLRVKAGAFSGSVTLIR